MPSTSQRYGFFFILIHWALVLIGVVLLGLGWYINYVQLASQERNFLLDIHISLGITSAILISIQIILRIVFKPPPYKNYVTRWTIRLSYTLYVLIYVSFIVMLVSGYLQAVFSAVPISFWGTPSPGWGEADVTQAGSFGTVHGIAAFVLAVSIFVHVGFAGMNKFKRPGIAPPTLPLGAPESGELVSDETKFQMVPKKVQNLAKNLRRFGWLGFWIEFVLAFVSGLLLAVATMGRAFNPGRAGFGDSIFWSGYGFMLLCFAVLLAFYYTRVAGKVASNPDSYFGRESRGAFWFLSIGMLIGLIGVVISIFGVALSITLLVAKTVSIPPGIMMMDPTQVIRALDVFILIVNFCLLIGHFIGTAISLWLRLSVSKVHVSYLEISGHKN